MNKTFRNRSPMNSNSSNNSRKVNRSNRSASNNRGNFSDKLRFNLNEFTGIVPLKNKQNNKKKQKEDTRDLIVVYFGTQLDVTSEYDGKRRVFKKSHLPFYKTTASSETNTKFPWLKDTWLPCFGIDIKKHVFKLSGLKSAQGAIGKWPLFLEQQKLMMKRIHEREILTMKRIHEREMLMEGNDEREKNISRQRQNFEVKSKLLYTMDTLHLNNDVDVIDEDIFFKAIGARCPCWSLLRISAEIGDGFWTKTPKFKKFVTDHTFDSVKRTFELETEFLKSVRKTKVMITSEVYKERDDEYSLDLLRCRLSDIPELQIVTEEGKETELVDFKA